MSKYRATIQLLREKKVSSKEVELLIRALYKHRRDPYIPYWYQLQLSGLCKALDVNMDDEFDLPSKIDDIFLYYAASNKDYVNIAGDDINDRFVNKYWSDDDSFIHSSARWHHDKTGYRPQFAVLFENELVFISKDRYEKAMKSVTQKDNDQEKLPIDNNSE